jgi:hypothetical protein
MEVMRIVKTERSDPEPAAARLAPLKETCQYRGRLGSNCSRFRQWTNVKNFVCGEFF